MPRKSFKYGLAVVAAACIAGFAASRAEAVGYWNTPGNFCQCWGYGWGAGYHSCLVLGPPSCSGWLNPHEVRLPAAPGPPCYCGGSICGCGDGDQSLWEPSALPSQCAQPAPAEASFASPVLR